MTATDQLPADTAAERYILGALVAFPDCAPEVFERLHARDFFDRTHSLIFETLAKQYATTGAVDAPQAGRQLKSRANADFSPTAYLLELGQPDNAATSIHVASEADKIVDASRKRQLFEIADSAREAAVNGQCANEVLSGLDADLWEFRRSSYCEPRYQAIDAQQLATGNYKLRYLIDHILVEGQPAFLGGPKKSLKTSLAMDLALSLTMGGCFLEKFPVKCRRRVAFLSGESGLASLQETALRVCRALGIDLASVDGFTLTTTLPRLQDESDLTDCERFLADVGAEVVIADPLYLMLTGDDAGNLFKQGALLRNWSEMCGSIKATGILCHHTKSTVADPFAPAELDHLAWSGCAEFARQWLLVSRREQYEPGTGEHRLWLTSGGSAGHSGLWAVDVKEGRQTDLEGRQWAVRVESATEARASAAKRKERAVEQRQLEQLMLDRSEVCRVLAKHPGGKTQTAIRNEVGISHRRWPTVLSAMLQAGDLIECEVTIGTKKTPQTGYRLQIKDSPNVPT